MKKLRKYIRKEIQSLHEQKSYPVPLELIDVMKDVLQMRPLKRYINNIKAVNSALAGAYIFTILPVTNASAAKTRAFVCTFIIT